MHKWMGILLLAGLGAAAQAADYPSDQGTLRVEERVGGLEHPWSMAFLPGDEGLLITERPGRLRLLGVDGTLSAPLAGVPAVYARGQGGLLDVALSPDFAEDRLVDRKSTRLNSSHVKSSYAGLCLETTTAQ